MPVITSLTDEELNTLTSGGELRVMYPMGSSKPQHFGTAYLHLSQSLKPSIRSKALTNFYTVYEHLNSLQSQLDQALERVSSLEKSCIRYSEQPSGTSAVCFWRSQCERLPDQLCHCKQTKSCTYPIPKSQNEN